MLFKKYVVAAVMSAGCCLLPVEAYATSLGASYRVAVTERFDRQSTVGVLMPVTVEASNLLTDGGAEHPEIIYENYLRDWSMAETEETEALRHVIDAFMDAVLPRSGNKARDITIKPSESGVALTFLF